MFNIKILGSGCYRCEKLFELTQDAVRETQVDARIEKVTDIDEILKYGVLMTPALVIDEKLKIAGRVPFVGEIKNLLKS